MFELPICFFSANLLHFHRIDYKKQFMHAILDSDQSMHGLVAKITSGTKSTVMGLF